MSSPLDPQLPDHDEVLEGLSPGLLPEHVPDWDRAKSLLPIFGLARSLFSTSPADTALKLVVLLALAKVEGRFSRERVRTLVPYLDPDKLEALVSRLYKGGWLELRASDNTYRLRPLALYTLSVLLAADFQGQTSANLLMRAVEALAFGDRVDPQTTGHLLAVLLAELETQAEQARDILGRGTPRQLIRFSRQQVGEQIRYVAQVLSAIEERMDATSAHFGRLVRIHASLQQILRAHEGLSRRLSEWSLKRLETSDAGYSLAALSDAVMGASDPEMAVVMTDGIVQVPARSVCLVTERLLTRHRTTRPTMAKEKAAFVYEPPPPTPVEELALQEIDPVARIAALLAELLESGADDAEITRALLGQSQDFADAVFQLNLLARLQGRSTERGIELVPGVVVKLSGRSFDSKELIDLDRQQALKTLLRIGVLVEIPQRGLHATLQIER
jgi:hypothetical protein